MLPVIFILTFMAVTLTIWGMFRPKPNIVSRRIRAESYCDLTRERRLEGSFGQRVIVPAALTIGRLLARLLPHRFVRSIDQMLIMANQPLSLPAYLTLWAGSLLLGLLVPFSLVRFGVLTGLPLIVIGLVALFYFALLPYFLLLRRVHKRQKSIIRGLPYALDLLVTCVEAGLGVDAAFATVTEKTNGPLSETLARYLRQGG